MYKRQAFLGIPFGDPYSMGEASNDQCTAPTHIRRYCERALRGLDRYDFDIGGTLLNGQDIKVVDCGDVVGEAKDVAGNHKRSEDVVRKILSKGAFSLNPKYPSDHLIFSGCNFNLDKVFFAFLGRSKILSNVYTFDFI